MQPTLGSPTLTALLKEMSVKQLTVTLTSLQNDLNLNKCLLKDFLKRAATPGDSFITVSAYWRSHLHAEE